MAKRIIESPCGTIAGFTLNKVFKIEFHWGTILEGDSLIERNIVDHKTVCGFKDTTFGLFCQDFRSYKILRTYAKMAEKAIGIRQGREEHDGRQYVILIMPTSAVLLSYDGKMIKWVKEYQNFNPYRHLRNYGWRYLTVDSQQSTNKKCWAIIDWFLGR